jgi:hypothetical protein
LQPISRVQSLCELFFFCFQTFALQVSEGAVGPLPPPIIATDPQRLPLTYAISFSTVSNVLTMNATTGLMSVNPPGFDYIGIVNSVRCCTKGVFLWRLIPSNTD